MDTEKVMIELSKVLDNLSNEDEILLNAKYDEYRLLENQGFFDLPLHLELDIPHEVIGTLPGKIHEKEVFCKANQSGGRKNEMYINYGHQRYSTQVKQEAMLELAFAI